MPRREGQVVPMESVSLDARLAMDKSWQAHWYRYVGEMMAGKTVLDVGTGTGYGLPLLREAGVASAAGFDIVPIAPGVPVATTYDYQTESFDCVLAIDVIEHVEDDKALLLELLRVAKACVFVTTPNWNVSRAVNPYHVREYTPVELQELLSSFGFCKPLGAQFHDGVNDHRIYVSNSFLEVTTRETFDPAETWHNQAVLLEKRRVRL